MTVKKAIYESSIANLLKSLSSIEGTESLLRYMLEYRSGLKNADKLNETQALALDAAKELLANEKLECVNRFGLTAWEAIAADSNGNAIAKAKSMVQSLSGDSAAMRNAFVLANAPGLLGISGVSKHITNGVVALGEKTKKRNSTSANSDRPSLRKVPAGSNFWYKYSETWYQIIGASSGIRLFNLSSRIEVTDKNDLPENASACQKLIMSWGDAFRGYVSTCPEGIVALSDEELMA